MGLSGPFMIINQEGSAVVSSEVATPRSAEQRTQETRALLEREVDAWVATADPETGSPYLVVLSLWWNGETMLFSTAASSPTSRNLQASGRASVGLGHTRDVVMIDGTVRAILINDLPADVADAFASKAGFDPREAANDYLYFEVRPQRIQAWREVNEQPGRVIMRDGVWLVD